MHIAIPSILQKEKPKMPKHDTVKFDVKSSLAARAYAIAANLLDGKGATTGQESGFSEVDVACTLGSQFLRINSIELGLKHIIAHEIEGAVPKKHDLVFLWRSLTEQWKKKITEETGISEIDIRDLLERYKNAAVDMRFFGGDFGARPKQGQSPKKDDISIDAQNLKRLSDILGSMAYPIIKAVKAEN